MNTTATVLIIVFIALMLLGVPIAFSMMGATMVGLIVGKFNFIVLASRLFGGMDSITLLAIPGFLLAGELMCHGGLAARLINLADKLIGHIRNGLSVVTIVVGMFFSAMNGVAAATTAAVGELMIPEMDKRGYDKSYVAAICSVVGPLGPIIPPSVIMIIYAVGGGISVGDLFMAGIVPGILIGVALIVCSYIMTSKMPLQVLPRASAKEVWAAFKEGFWAILTPVIILGGIYGGFCTPTEAAVIAVFYSLFTGIFIYKELDWEGIKTCLVKSMESTAMVMIICGAAQGFGWMVTVTNISTSIAAFVTSITDNELIILILMEVVLMIIGCFMDTISAVVIFQAVLLPIAKAIGMDMLQFAAIFIVFVALGNATPPFGYALFVGSRISGCSLEQISKKILPMLVACFIVAFILDFFPILTLGLPTFLNGLR
ncbi:MAG: TRAP transporter large permease [Lachnospiraceae bacterium]|nr:TRAP transporter large permease [Lachnospiraceae bacterium]